MLRDVMRGLRWMRAWNTVQKAEEKKERGEMSEEVREPLIPLFAKRIDLVQC